MNAKASTTEIVLWLAIITTVLIAMAWFFSTISAFQQSSFERIDSDLAKIESMINDACNLYSYKYSYNPLTNDGNFSIKDSSICIEAGSVQKCQQLLCKTGLDKTIGLHSVKELWIEKNSFGIDIYGQ